jgi:hypothetical protein
MTSIPSAIRHGTARPRRLVCGLFQKEIAVTIGTVKFFNTQKGFGFIAPQGGASDAFCAYHAVEQAGMAPNRLAAQSAARNLIKTNRR